MTEDDIRWRRTSYRTSTGRELFLEALAQDDRLAGFLRLSLPASPVACEEISRSAMVREVHVYGRLVGLGREDRRRAQHRGLGTTLMEWAAREASEAGYTDLAVISAIGTRDYYRGLGYHEAPLYQHLPLPSGAAPPGARPSEP